MSILDVPDPDGFLYIVADSHLDEKMHLPKSLWRCWYNWKIHIPSYF